MQNHFHTDGVQLVITALGVLIVFHVLRIVSVQMVGSDNAMISTTGKGIAGLVTFSAS